MQNLIDTKSFTLLSLDKHINSRSEEEIKKIKEYFSQNRRFGDKKDYTEEKQHIFF